MKKVTPPMEINSALTMQIALATVFASKSLPELSVSHYDKTIYLTGPCGQQLCKVMFTGTTSLKPKDYPIVYDQVVAFINKNLKTLKKLFNLRKAVKVAKAKIPNGYNFYPKDKNSSVIMTSSHKSYHTLLSYVYEESFMLNNVNVKDKDFEKLFATLQEKLAEQRTILKSHISTNEMEREANSIIEQLSNCSI